jgi:hypothetical protein
VNRKLQGQGIGGQLLLAAGRRCLMAAAQVGGIVLFIDAKNARVARWCASYGAVPLLDAPLTLLLTSRQLRPRLKRLVNSASTSLVVNGVTGFRRCVKDREKRRRGKCLVFNANVDVLAASGSDESQFDFASSD